MKNPIDIYTCRECQSIVTLPLPSKEELTALYSSYHDGMSPTIRNLRTNNPLTAWYRQCVARATKQVKPNIEKNTVFSWIDVGAGGGELARIMALEFPGSIGTAIDFHNRPFALDGISNVDWISCDLNEDFSSKINRKFDLVTSITVIEHVLSPGDHIKNCRQLMKNDGALYVTAPCADTLAEKVLGKSWPYMIPGEHLNIPSVKGMAILLQRLGEGISPHVFANKTILPYTLGYFLSFFRLSFLRSVVPHSFPVKLPTGILEAGYSSGDKGSSK